ncbi:ATP-binding protein [Candidatus Peregrinibacteria bacterium]|nr:ATP-binding protein [Candidatus Peregrinibacteria bacterium]
MIKRSLKIEIERSIKKFPVVSIIGSRQVGKTTLAKEILKSAGKNAIYLDLELPSDINKLNDPELYLGENEDKMIIIDEVQRMPELFPVLRALIDRKKKNGRFLLLGSASPLLLKNSSQSLAGRIIHYELSPLSLKEISGREHDYKQLWLKGGYPLSYLEPHTQSSLWRKAFIQTHLERDIPQLGIRIPSPKLHRFLTMMAHMNGQLLNASTLARSLGLSSPTINHYLEIFEGTFILRSLRTYHPNLKKRLVKSPKIYFRDTGILHTLLNIETYDALQSNPYVGHSWEAFVIEQIIAQMPAKFSPYFYRTAAGAEIDLILKAENSSPIAVEIKYSLSPRLSKGFHYGYQDLGCKKGVVIYPGKDIYKIAKNIIALPVNRLVELF